MSIAPRTGPSVASALMWRGAANALGHTKDDGIAVVSKCETGFIERYFADLGTKLISERVDRRIRFDSGWGGQTGTLFYVDFDDRSVHKVSVTAECLAGDAIIAAVPVTSPAVWVAVPRTHEKNHGCRIR